MFLKIFAEGKRIAEMQLPRNFGQGLTGMENQHLRFGKQLAVNDHRRLFLADRFDDQIQLMGADRQPGSVESE